ncbi:hypothetical protein IEQ34_003202 [Dendrobium chrysotoxum]|uniref:Phytocyanin domain-containing protein n=1 Tax=Dendrobium chrysotoxum TaxID=161865 RepID=A0AAV7HKB2_DENCH|nr:hypothetical protein IEQ34_003202 [Dendrobium chrysotoxum]
MRASIVIALLIAATGAASLTTASVHNVGDFAGWTVEVNYSVWSSTKSFNVGDIIVFIYNKSLHDVVELEEADFSSCNVASPISTYSTGNDSITIYRYGHSFFACGFPGHCVAGQKLDIYVPKNLSATLSARRSAHHGKGETTSISGYGMVAVVVTVTVSVIILRFVIFTC